ncbi:YncE family protein [Dyella nitratireducens]|uniref:Uncharacterized protein n=1 Tax=Dyella nitratireducens TaxID=1849580 RepID=A0ABQ1G6Q2_9GAMM|nr:hypothetical protein [Dyella nitratireducens]GGA37842.1 hypothetical protein GCM10010981_28750 [Dyella nitratireducens]GLQ40234.1 hypothetical protein GCM10007902_00830 [Dyella nitratireducens]
MIRRVLAAAIALSVLPLYAQTPSKIYAQELVDQTIATHPDIVVMAIHATPPKQKDNVIIASNIGRIGKKGDADDMGVVNTGKPLVEVNKAGDRLEVELPLFDTTGDTLGALSIVYPYHNGDDKQALQQRAEQIRGQLARRISNPGNLTQPYQYDASTPTNTLAQQLVDQAMVAYPDVIILAMHATPPGSSSNVIVGSSIGRIGKAADDDDLRAIRTGIPNLEVNGNRFEVETRLLDAGKQTIGAIGIVFRYKPGDDKKALEQRAYAIRDELAAKIPSLTKLMAPPAAADPASAPATLIGRSTTWKPQYSGDFDHFGVDTKRNKLLLAAEDHGTLEVFNLDTGAHEKTLTTFSTPHAILYLPEKDRLIVTDSGKGGTRVLDAATYKVLGYINTAPGADSMVYDKSNHLLYIVSGGKDVDMKECYLNEVDPYSGKVYRKLRFDSDHVEAVRAEEQGHRLFVNVADKNLVAVVDKKTLQVIASWPLTGAQTNLSMALDEADHRLFIGTRNPSKLIVLDTETGKQVASLDAPATSDGLFYDNVHKRIYIPGGDGYLGVFQQNDADHYTELARVPSAQGAKSGMLWKSLDRIYLAASPGDKGKGGEILWFALHP